MNGINYTENWNLESPNCILFTDNILSIMFGFVCIKINVSGDTLLPNKTAGNMSIIADVLGPQNRRTVDALTGV